MKKAFCSLAILLLTTAILHAQPPSATEILNEARTAAAKEKKKVFIIFHASWCGWCHKMDTILQSPAVAPVFNKYYITRHITVLESDNKKNLENPGGKAFMDEYHGGNSGIPYWLVFDEKGTLLADARIRKEGSNEPGSNSGCPATKEEIDYFTRTLRATSGITAGETETIAKAFRTIRGL
ncbi:MAG: thioredoxin family protein [Chitinophagaceae bacterium]